MSGNPQIKVPTSVEDLIRDPQRVADAFTLLNLIANMQVILIAHTSSTRGVSGLSIAGERATLGLPFLFAAPIADSTATAASASAQLNLVLAQLRISGILPT